MKNLNLTEHDRLGDEQIEQDPSASDAPKGEAGWQRHVMFGLWIVLAVVIVASVALVFARAHGLLGPHADPTAPPPPWPAGS